MTDPHVVTSREAFASAAADAPPGARVPVEVHVRVADPFDAYRRAREDADWNAYVETTGGQPGWGYFAVDPVDAMTVSADATVRSTDSRPAQSPTLAALQGLLDGETLVRGDCDVPYPCGAIGWLSYDVARELESLPESAVDDRQLPHLQVGVYDRIAAWEEPRDSEETTLRITACPSVAADDDLEDIYERSCEHALDLATRATTGDPGFGDPPVAQEDATFQSDCGREAYADRVRRVKEYVHAGDTFQANVSQRLVAPAAVHPVAAYDALRTVNPAPYSGLFEFPRLDLVSASPELLLDRDGESVRTEPIAGTRPRGHTPEEDDELAADLTSDEKERAEHAMLVDLERNDLGKVCEYGTVEVAEYRRVDRYSEVMHLVSNVTGDLRDDATLADAIAAVFPGGTITGAPKPRTMEIIDELESTRRGPYTGSMGLFGFDDRATLNIVIRTLVRSGDEYHLRVGAGIVHDSVPEREYEETLDKARALVTAVDEALGDRAGLTVEGAGDD
ncbi:aminodeoxychorismate synthase, component I [Haloarchaeobius sp. HME9146]|uniref:aminodeoxychorismate synthase, component I n=1 Tax=Haloarchaeobius sp. HME9146 TaxID=2978732 RepID=UPI0021C02CAF|nr:aminodeoxychorismate synthase, component I [Haloarchaeobius sp. HME9146]MCT9095872.1 aminodeoxychorismate synthase, component I [Haloarchaeobius sp. HME9146]